MNQDVFSRSRETLACLAGRRSALHRSVDIAVYKVGDGFDRPFDGEIVEGFLAQILRNCGYAVALLDAVAGNGQVSAVDAYESYVGAVQSCDEGQAAPWAAHIWRASSALTECGMA